MRCDLCGGPAAACAPGTEDEVVGDLFRVARGERRRAWCLLCWVRVFKLDEAA
jgi:hypothetical protein